MIESRKFIEYFNGHESKYVIIGGTACELLMEAEELPVRATKDIDRVLIVEALTSEFGEAFWKFVQDAGYHYINKGTGKAQFFRFSNPKSHEYPYMIELFSRKKGKSLYLIMQAICNWGEQQNKYEEKENDNE